MPLPRYAFEEGDDDEQDHSYSHAESSSSRLSPLADRSASRSRTTPYRIGVDDTNDTSYTLGSGGEANSGGSHGKMRQTSVGPDLDALLLSTDVSLLDESATSYSKMTPFEQMSLFWTTQKAAPEILPFPTTAFNTLLHQMEQQQSILDSLLSNNTATDSLALNPDGSAAESIAPIENNEDEYLRLNLVQVDLERTKWLLKHTLRTRMDLLQKHANYIVASPEQMGKLTQTEQTFVQQFWSLKADHFSSSVLAFLPEQLGNLDNPETSREKGSTNMVPEPDLDSPVFVRCLEDCGPVKLPDSETASLTKDSVHFLRYRSVRHLVYDWRVVLI